MVKVKRKEGKKKSKERSDGSDRVVKVKKTKAKGADKGVVKAEIIQKNAWSLKIPEFTKNDNPHGMLEESSFATLFPQYVEQYLKLNWPRVTAVLSEHGIKAELDLVEGSMTVRTTKKTWDPYIIIKARDMIKLLSRSVPVESAIMVLKDDVAADIIKIGSMLRNKSKFIKRRQRLIGPNGATLKAIELLTRCYILVQGQTVSAIGPYKGLAAVRKVVTDTFNNIHPIYNIKIMMIRRELASNPLMKNESWDRFMPKFKTSNVSKRKQPMKKKPKKPYTPFPPAPVDSKVDIALASGEYFLKPEQKRARQEKEKNERQAVKETERQERRQTPFDPPSEPSYSAAQSHGFDEVNVDALKQKLASGKKAKRAASANWSQ